MKFKTVWQDIKDSFMEVLREPLFTMDFDSNNKNVSTLDDIYPGHVTNEVFNSPEPPYHSLGDELWFGLMDYCHKRGVSPGNEPLFAVVTKVRALEKEVYMLRKELK